jgi:hypothetical protein
VALEYYSLGIQMNVILIAWNIKYSFGTLKYLLVFLDYSSIACPFFDLIFIAHVCIASPFSDNLHPSICKVPENPSVSPSFSTVAIFPPNNVNKLVFPAPLLPIIAMSLPRFTTPLTPFKTAFCCMSLPVETGALPANSLFSSESSLASSLLDLDFLSPLSPPFDPFSASFESSFL